VVSALSNHEIREFNRNPKRMGVDEFIPKPITRETVRTLLTKIKPEGEKVIQVSSPALGNHPRDERMSSVDSRRRHN